MSAEPSYGLKKTLGYFSLTNIVEGDMIGAGIFTTSALAFSEYLVRAMPEGDGMKQIVMIKKATSVLTIIGPRVNYAMAESGHFFGIAKRINRSNVPGISILMQSGLAIVFILSGTFDQIITLLSFSLAILVLAFLERPLESSVSLGIILAGIPAFYLLKKRNISS